MTKLFGMPYPKEYFLPIKRYRTQSAGILPSIAARGAAKNREVFLTELDSRPFDELAQTYRVFPKRGIRVFQGKQKRKILGLVLG